MRSHLLLKDSDSQTKASARADDGLLEEDFEYILVAPMDNFGPKSGLPAPPKDISVKKKSEGLSGPSLKRVRREGSGTSESKQANIFMHVFKHVFVLRRALSAQIY